MVLSIGFPFILCTDIKIELNSSGVSSGDGPPFSHDVIIIANLASGHRQIVFALTCFEYKKTTSLPFLIVCMDLPRGLCHALAGGGFQTDIFRF